MEEFFVFVGFVLALVCGLAGVQMWLKHRQERLRVLDETLKSGDLDPDTKRQIVQSLQGGFPIRTILFSIGWIAIFLGVGLIAADDRDAFYAGIVIAPIGFGIVTLPLALREIEARKGA